jgi:hypothetical protein
MARFVGLHTLPGFRLRFPYDEICEVEAICEAGEAGVTTRELAR